MHKTTETESLDAFKSRMLGNGLQLGIKVSGLFMIIGLVTLILGSLNVPLAFYLAQLSFVLGFSCFSFGLLSRVQGKSIDAFRLGMGLTCIGIPLQILGYVGLPF